MAHGGWETPHVPTTGRETESSSVPTTVSAIEKPGAGRVCPGDVTGVRSGCYELP